MSVTPESIAIQVKLDGKQAEKGLKKIEKSLKGFGRIGKANNKIFGDFLRLAGFAGLTKMTIDAAHFAHSMQVLGQKTGIATDKLSQMSNVWKSWGADAKSLDAFAKKLSSDLSMRRTTGGSAFYSAFRSMGINPLTSSGNIRDLKDLFGDVADYAQKMKSRGIKDWEIIGILEKTLGMPPEVIGKMLQGRGAWNKYYEETSGKVGSLTSEEISKGEQLNQAFNESLLNTQVAIQKATLALSDYFIPILEKISSFAKENPKTTSAIGVGTLFGATGLGLAGLRRFIGGKGLTSATGTAAVSGASKLPLLLASLGVFGTLSEMSGYNLVGQKIKKTKPDMVDDLVNWADRTFSSSPSLDVMKLAKPKEKFWAETLKGWYETGVISSNELREMLGKDEYGGNFVTPLLKEMTKNAPEKFGKNGYSWQNLWESYDTGRAETIKSYSPTFNQENSFIINGGSSGSEIANQVVDKLGQDSFINPIYKAMTGGAY